MTMLFTARLEAQITKIYGKTVEVEAETRADAQDIAEDQAMESSNEEIEVGWDLLQDDDLTGV
jgi:hypothetical protein